MSDGYLCGGCGEWHAELPLVYHAEAPVYWTEAEATNPRSELTSDQCVIDGEHFFVRGLVRLPISGLDESFEWGVWVSVSEANLLSMSEKWMVEGREESDPAFGWLATELPGYEPSTLNLKTNVHTQPVRQRPLIELEPTEHPLAVQQRVGVTLEWVQTTAAALLHD